MRFPKPLLLSLALLLSACAAPPGPRQPEPTSPPEASSPGDGHTPPAEASRPYVTGPAASGLLAEARRAEQAGDLPTVEALLERALRIEPRNPFLWHYLARLRMRQGELVQAVGLAEKSNRLTGADRRLQAENWRLIADAKAALGDRTAAQQARLRAEALQP